MIIRPYNPTARRREEKNGRNRIGRARYSTLFILHFDCSVSHTADGKSVTTLVIVIAGHIGGMRT